MKQERKKLSIRPQGMFFLHERTGIRKNGQCCLYLIFYGCTYLLIPNDLDLIRLLRESVCTGSLFFYAAIFDENDLNSVYILGIALFSNLL